MNVTRLAVPKMDCAGEDIVLAINATMFATEVGAALLADSSALLSDSLDRFADGRSTGLRWLASDDPAIRKSRPRGSVVPCNRCWRCGHSPKSRDE